MLTREKRFPAAEPGLHSVTMRTQGVQEQKLSSAVPASPVLNGIFVYFHSIVGNSLSSFFFMDLMDVEIDFTLPVG